MRVRILLLIVVLSLLATVTSLAQDDSEPVDTSNVSYDDVNAVAHQLYCPVCENIPLDTCGTAACEDWRQEIRVMLAQGLSEDEIINNFVVRFGDRVVSSPRDPVIAAISNITPWLVLAVISIYAIYQLLQWQKKEKVKISPNNQPDAEQPSDARSSYLEQLEKDLAGK